VLRDHGVFRALVEAGGDIVVSGPPPNEPGWRIEITNLPATAPASEQFVTLTNGAVSSSGDTEQYVTFAGRRYSHVVDPRTGLGLTSRVAVTCSLRTGLTSDSLSTALSVLGEARGRDLIRRRYPGVRVLIRTAADHGPPDGGSRYGPKGTPS
jgi:thiamine biosynthesis lipoprotein